MRIDAERLLSDARLAFRNGASGGVCVTATWRTYHADEVVAQSGAKVPAQERAIAAAKSSLVRVVQAELDTLLSFVDKGASA